MKIQEFDYTKDDGERTHRRVLVLHSNREYEDVIDLDKLSEKEAILAIRIQKMYEDTMKKYTDKAFRRFSKEKMTNLVEEKN
jgi:hypothetical protein